MNEVTTPGSLNEPQTRDTLLKELTQQVADALLSTENTIGLIREMRSSLAIDVPLLKPETQYTKEQVIDMLKQAYNLGATAHEENMTVCTNRWSDNVNVHVDMEEGGFRYYGDVEVDSDIIKDAVTFEDHDMTDEQVEEILKA